MIEVVEELQVLPGVTGLEVPLRTYMLKAEEVFKTQFILLGIVVKETR